MTARLRTAVFLGLLIAWYLAATLPHLGSFPLMEWAQAMIAAPAWKLASQGIFGSDIFSGFFRSEAHNYDHLPLYPLLLAAAFKLGGLGIIQARLVSVAAGLAVLLLTYRLGRSWYGQAEGLLAVALLVFLRLSVPNANDVLRLGYQVNASGIPLLDFARVIRFDILVPVWVLAALLILARAQRTANRLDYLASGLLAGLAALTHAYGAFVLVLMLLALAWQQGIRQQRADRAEFARLAFLLAGFGLALLPYGFYILQDPQAFLGQALRHEARIAFFSPRFFVESLGREPWRYLSWLGGSFRRPVLWPRLGIYVLAAGVLGGMGILWVRIRQQARLEDRLLWLGLPVQAGLLGLLINLKRYPYISILLPFLALLVALSIATVWRGWARRTSARRILLAGLLAAIMLEGLYGVANAWVMAARTTDYEQIQSRLRKIIPADTRLLSTHLAWFALSDRDFRSANLVFVLSDPAYGDAYRGEVDQVIRSIDPDMIVMEQRLLKIYRTDPGSLPDVQTAERWRAFDAYISENCRSIERIAAADYGDIGVYRCRH